MNPGLKFQDGKSGIEMFCNPSPSRMGFCFSVSLPPTLSAGAMKSLDILQNNPDLNSDLAQKYQI
jgi:7-keto-8-aminopelargonate synthetase-like enzyme